MEPQVQHSDIRLLVTRRLSKNLLVWSSEDGLRLPGWTAAERHFWQEVDPINLRGGELLKAEIATLRAFSVDWSGERRDTCYVVELLDSQAPGRASGRWIDVRDAERMTWARPADRASALSWFRECPAARRVDWYRSGYYERAVKWIESSIERAGLAQTGQVVQLRSWERSSVMRAPTGHGFVYYKAVPAQWGHEPGLTAWLTERFPSLTPDVVAADPAGGRLLMREFAGKPLPAIGDIALWENTYAGFGAMQRALTTSISDLRQLGVPWRSLEAVRNAIPATLRDRRRMRLGMSGGLTAGLANQLQSAEGMLLDACQRLLDGPVPLSLDHGDFWPGNAFASPNRVTIFDWSDATVSHPFFSLVMSADEISASFQGNPGAARQVIDAYLGEWSDFGTQDELRSLFADAMLVAPFHIATMYRTTYLPAMEFPDELDRMTPHMLQWMVGQL